MGSILAILCKANYCITQLISILTHFTSKTARQEPFMRNHGHIPKEGFSSIEIDDYLIKSDQLFYNLPHAQY